MIASLENGMGERATYDSEHHRFWSGTETDYEASILGEMVSVTKLISQFYCVSPWRGEKTDIDFGNRVHAVASDCLNGRKTEIRPDGEDERAAFSALWRFARRIRDNNRVVGVEKHLFSSHAGVAGIADLVFECNDRVFMCDWKTGDIMLPAKCKFNSPFGHLVADPLTVYSIQCSMYQVLLEVGGYLSNAAFAPSRLLWLHMDEGEWKVDAVTCRDLRREAAQMMLMRSYTPWYVDWQKRCPF